MLDLAPLDPFALMRDFDRLFESPRRGPARWLPRIDVFDREKDLVVRIEVAGVNPDDIELTVEDRTLTISGSRALERTETADGFHRREIFSGEFRRTLVLPEGLDATAISAKAEHGMLEVTVPRKPEVLPRKVKVEISA